MYNGVMVNNLPLISYLLKFVKPQKPPLPVGNLPLRTQFCGRGVVNILVLFEVKMKKQDVRMENMNSQ